MKIEHIAIQSSGPVTHFDHPVSPCTLIYAPNETGKTTIVENIISSLFHDTKDGLFPELRGPEFTSSSRVQVVDSEGNHLSFSPGGKKKKLNTMTPGREGAWKRGLVNLLYVRAGALSLGREHPFRALRSLISSQDQYDALEKVIPGEVGYTTCEKGILVDGHDKGGYQKLQRSRSERSDLGDVMKSFVENESAQKLRDLEEEKETLAGRQLVMLKARRYRAWELSRELEKAREERNLFPEDQVDLLEKKMSHCTHLSSEKIRLEETIRAMPFTSDDFQWLIQVKNRVTELGGNRPGVPSWVLPLVALVVFSGGLASWFMRPGLMPWFLGTGLLLLAVSLVVTFVQQGTRGKREEVRELLGEVQDRYDRDCRVLPDLELIIDQVRNETAACQSHQKRLDEINEELQKLELEIHSAMKHAGFSEDDDPSQVITSMKARIRELDSKCITLEEKLIALQVDPSDYTSEKPKESWSQQAFDQVRERLDRVQDELSATSGELNRIRTAIAPYLGSEKALSAPADELYLSLNQLYTEKIIHEEDLAATIIAGHLLKDQLDELRNLEEREMEVFINDPLIAGRLSLFTGRESRFVLEDGDIYIETPAGTWPLSSMSTGAWDQTMLAFRSGIAEKVSGGEPMFFILDDVLQHTDWQRREVIVQALVKLVQDGWQVIYLTMDDHVRKLFNQAGKTLGKDGFSEITL